MPIRKFQPTITLDELARRHQETLAEQAARKAETTQSGQQTPPTEDQ